MLTDLLEDFVHLKSEEGDEAYVRDDLKVFFRTARSKLNDKAKSPKWQYHVLLDNRMDFSKSDISLESLPSGGIISPKYSTLEEAVNAFLKRN